MVIFFPIGTHVFRVLTTLYTILWFSVLLPFTFVHGHLFLLLGISRCGTDHALRCSGWLSELKVFWERVGRHYYLRSSPTEDIIGKTSWKLDFCSFLLVTYTFTLAHGNAKFLESPVRFIWGLQNWKELSMSKWEVEEACEPFSLHMGIRNRAGKYLNEDYLCFCFLRRVIQSVVEHFAGTMNAKII